MVERFFSRLSAPIGGLHEAAYVLALLTLASQLLALLRDRTFAHLFGAGETLDLYLSAFRLPDLVFALVASLVSAYVLIPRLSGKGSEEVRRLLSHSASFLLIVGGIFCLLLALFAPLLLELLYPRFAASSQFPEFILLTRLLLLQPIVLGISGVVTSYTQSDRRFILFAVSPVLYNVGIMFGAIVLYPLWGLVGIGTGVVLGAFFHLAIHIPLLVGAHVFPHLVVPSWRIIGEVVRDSIPRALALGMGSLTLLGLTVLAARGSEGAVSVLALAGNLEAVPLALIGASYAVAAFPALAEHSAKGAEVAFTRVLSAAARNIMLWSLVFLGLIIVLRAHIVRVVLGSGAFDWDATRLTAALLAILAAGLVAQGLVLLFSRALYARGQSWWPFAYQLAAGIVTIALAAYLLAVLPPHFLDWISSLFRVDGVPGIEILFIAFAATVGQWILALLLLAVLTTRAPALAPSLIRPLIHGVLAAVAGGVAAYGVLVLIGGVLPLITLFAVFTDGVVAGIVGLAASALVLTVLRNEEFLQFAQVLRHVPGLRTVPPAAPESAQS